MKAIRIDGHAVNGDRRKLSEQLPLDTPYSITVFPIYACNFKCNYCLHSLDEDKRGVNLQTKIMDIKLYKKFIDDLKVFPNKIKALHFAGIGEPLLHKNIIDMVEYTVKSEVADIVDIVTNGALLTEELSKGLIKAGLSKLRISIQGLNSNDYYKVSKVAIDFDKFVENIKYFYDNRGNTKLYIKILDDVLKDGEDTEFTRIFGDICDNLAIEHLCPFVNEIDYNKISANSKYDYTVNGNKLIDSEVCPQPFYAFQILPDGLLVPCCTLEIPLVIGDIKLNSVQEIWNSEKLKNFRVLQLKKNKNINKVCSNCKQYKYSMLAEDRLDEECEGLLKLYEK